MLALLYRPLRSPSDSEAHAYLALEVATLIPMVILVTSSGCLAI